MNTLQLLSNAGGGTWNVSPLTSDKTEKESLMVVPAAAAAISTHIETLMPAATCRQARSVSTALLIQQATCAARALGGGRGGTWQGV